MQGSLHGDNNATNDYLAGELMAAPTNDRSHSTLKNDPRIVSKAKYSQAPFSLISPAPVEQTQAGSGYLGHSS